MVAIADPQPTALNEGDLPLRSVKPLLTLPGDGSHRPADTSESESLRPEQKTPLIPEALAITAVRISIFPFFFFFPSCEFRAVNGLFS